MTDKPFNDPLKALLIEPSNIVQKVLASILQRHGFQVDTCTKAEDALRLSDKHFYDMVCVALLLPDSSGTEVCRQLRKISKEKRNIPVILITSEDDKGTLLEVLKAGATEIFKKNDIMAFDSYLTQFVWSTQESRSLCGKILYVEDSPSIYSMVMELLKLNGMKVDHFTKAEDAYDSFQRHDYDLVITDIFLEGDMSGSQLAQKIRMADTKRTIPILAISGVEDSSRRVALLKSGVNDYVPKPVMDDELMARVNNLIRSKKLFDRVQEQQETLRELAMKDQLTGLYNRHFLMESGPKRIREAQRHNLPISMVVIDLDRFKLINDNYGHSTGDTVLKEVGSLLQFLSRREDIASRIGGEEFVLIMAYCDQQSAFDKAEKIRKAIMNLKPAGLEITASFGVASLSAEDDGIRNLFERADKAVYESKNKGRNCVTSG